MWNGQVVAPASGQQQIHRLLDGLARLPRDTREGPELVEALAHPACRSFRDGLQVVITTDAALHQADRSFPPDEQQRWVVLQTTAFQGAAAGPLAPSLPLRPWLWVDAVQRVPALLRGEWKEAQHGS